MGQEKVTRQFEFGLARGATFAQIEALVMDEKKCKGFMPWEIYQPLCPPKPGKMSFDQEVDYWMKKKFGGKNGSQP